MEHSSLLFYGVLITWAILAFAGRYRRRIKLKFQTDAATGQVEAKNHGPVPFDDIEPQGDLLVDNLDVPAVMHYARPSGAIDVKPARIQRIYGKKDAQGLQIGTVMGAPETKGKPRTPFQFYRLRSIEDPATGQLMVGDLDKARWLAAKGRLV